MATNNHPTNLVQPPSLIQIMTVVSLLPVAGALLGLAAIIIVCIIIGLVISTPVFVIFSPIVVPVVMLLSWLVKILWKMMMKNNKGVSDNITVTGPDIVIPNKYFVNDGQLYISTRVQVASQVQGPSQVNI